MKRNRLSSRKGITILEVLVAMIVLAVSLLLLLNMAMVALDGNDWANNTTLATQMMQEKMEQLRTFGELTDGSDSSDGINRTWTITNAGSHLRRVDVSVTWRDMRDCVQTNSLTQFIQVDSV